MNFFSGSAHAGGKKTKVGDLNRGVG